MPNNDWNEVVSSNISAWKYDPETKVLGIRFVKNDEEYFYDEVPRSVAEGFKTASSAGQYFRRNILNRYRFWRE